jgi:hypothetical protein
MTLLKTTICFGLLYLGHLQVLYIIIIREEITEFIAQYRDIITTQTNELASTLLEEEEDPRRLKIFKPTDLTTRFS